MNTNRHALRVTRLVLAGGLCCLAATGCDGDSRQSGQAQPQAQSSPALAQISAAATPKGGILAGPAGPDVDPATLQDTPTREQVDSFLAQYNDMLTYEQATALLLPLDSLPTEAELAALLTKTELATTQELVATRDWADAELVRKADFPDPAEADLVTLAEAESTYAPADAEKVYQGLALKSDVPAPGVLETAEMAQAYEPQSALDDVVKGEINQELQPVGGPLRAELAEQVRHAVRTRRYNRPCPAGMAGVADACVDQFEASIWTQPNCQGVQHGTSAANSYPANFPRSGQVAAGARLYACSAEKQVPSRYVSWFQAAQACAAAGKRLCTNAEWQLAAMGTPDNPGDCTLNTDGSPAVVVATSNLASTCVSMFGVYDTVGSVAEWVADWELGHYGENLDKWLTDNNFIATGVWPADVSADDATLGLGSRVRLSETEAKDALPGAVVRGGASTAGSGPAGAFAASWNWAPVAVRADIGFRCCSDRY